MGSYWVLVSGPKFIKSLKRLLISLFALRVKSSSFLKEDVCGFVLIGLLHMSKQELTGILQAARSALVFVMPVPNFGRFLCLRVFLTSQIITTQSNASQNGYFYEWKTLHTLFNWWFFTLCNMQLSYLPEIHFIKLCHIT